MIFENTNLEGKTIQFSVLEHVASSLGLVRVEQWDYARATYDYKFENMMTGDVYYLRIPAVAIEGMVEQANAIMKIGKPYVGKHYYPHGVEYDEEFPDDIIKTCNEKLSQLSEKLEGATA
ncbi:YugN family protein [Pueribacillus sp. YX66]|uniref:YugN family protein n=1 Tax=Pueribacillus sp. YX66 TaxID=3229242 RepID=UPI00358D13A8